jgi:hypothetical protein
MPTSFSASELYKIAAMEGSPDVPERTWGQFGHQLAFGKGLSHVMDPNNRGMLADAALYSNAVTGVPTAILDTGRHLWNGHWGSALGSAAMGGLSFIPGAASALGVAGRAGLAGAKGVAGAATKQVARQAARAVSGGNRTIANTLATAGRNTGMQSLDNAALAVNNYARSGAKAVTNAQNSFVRGAEKVLPGGFQHQSWQHGFQNPLSNGAGQWGLRSPVAGGRYIPSLSKSVRSGIDTVAQNPLSSATFFHGYGANGVFDPTNTQNYEDAHAQWLNEQFK